jgi:3-dehydroquinate synthase
MIHIKSNIHDYVVNFHEDFDFFSQLRCIPHKVIVIDTNVHRLYPQLTVGMDKDDVICIDATEINKNLDQVQNLLSKLVIRPEKRQLTLISVGGGIIQDITGFAASNLYRGINWIFVPTTLLAQADSCVGSKTSINFAGFKNILGGFYPPHQIHICVEFLYSLAPKDFKSGVGEIIKFLLLDDTKVPNIDEIQELVVSLYQKRLLKEGIESSLKVKQSYINKDEFDVGKRNLFNYGHCFGHALEVSSQFEVPHGMAVTIGMIFANIVAKQKGWLSVDTFNQLDEKLLIPNIAIDLMSDWFNPKVLLEALKNDKKRSGTDLTLILPSSDKIEAVKIQDFTESEFYAALTELRTVLSL